MNLDEQQILSLNKIRRSGRIWVWIYLITDIALVYYLYNGAIVHINDNGGTAKVLHASAFPLLIIIAFTIAETRVIYARNSIIKLLLGNEKGNKQ